LANTGLWFELTTLMASIPLLGPNKPWQLTTMNRLAPAEYAVGKKQKKHARASSIGTVSFCFIKPVMDFSSNSEFSL